MVNQVLLLQDPSLSCPIHLANPYRGPPAPHARSHLLQTLATPSTFKLLCIQSCAWVALLTMPCSPAFAPCPPPPFTCQSQTTRHLLQAVLSTAQAWMGTLLWIVGLPSSLFHHCLVPRVSLPLQRSVTKAGSQFCLDKWSFLETQPCPLLDIII